MLNTSGQCLSLNSMRQLIWTLLYYFRAFAAHRSSTAGSLFGDSAAFYHACNLHVTAHRGELPSISGSARRTIACRCLCAVVGAHDAGNGQIAGGRVGALDSERLELV